MPHLQGRCHLARPGRGRSNGLPQLHVQLAMGKLDLFELSAAGAAGCCAKSVPREQHPCGSSGGPAYWRLWMLSRLRSRGKYCSAHFEGSFSGYSTVGYAHTRQQHGPDSQIQHQRTAGSQHHSQRVRQPLRFQQQVDHLPPHHGRHSDGRSRSLLLAGAQ